MNRLFTTCIFILFLAIAIGLSSTWAPVQITGEDLTKEELAELCFKKGEDAELVYHDWPSAIKYYKEALKLAPNNKIYQRKVAFGYLQLGRYKEAIEIYESLLTQAKGFKQGWYELGKAYLSAGNEEEAMAKFKKAIELDATYADPHLDIGVIYETKYQQATDKAARETAKREAKEHYTTYLRLTQEEYGSGAQQAQSGLILLKYGKDLSEAYKAGLEAYEKASRSGQSEADIRDNFKLAYDKFQECLGLNSNCQEAHYMLGMVYNSVGFVEYNPGEAEAEWKKAPQIKQYNPSEAEAEWKKAPQIKQALVELGRLNRHLGNYAAAQDYLNAALKLDATYQRAHYELGLVFQNMHDIEKAIECWVDANEPDEDSTYAREARREITRLAPNHPLAKHVSDESIPPDFPDDYQAAISKIEKEYGGAIPVPETTILDQMCQRIVWEADLPNKQYKVKILNSEKKTAFSVPDGSIYITQGLLQFVRDNFPKEPIDVNNNILSFVLVHELHHIVARHATIQQVVEATLPRIDDREKVYFGLKFQRQQEFEADQNGVLYMFKAGYDPGASLRFLETYGKGREVTPEKDHPTYQARIHYLEEYWTNEVKFAYDAFQAGVNSYNEAERLESQNNLRSKELYDKAQQQFEQFLKIFDNTKQALNNLGLAYYKLALTETNPRMTDWRLVLALDPQLAFQFQRLHEHDITRGPRPDGKRYDEYYLEQAILNFKEALRIDPNYTKALLNLSSAQILFGKYADAQATLEQLLALESDERGALEYEEHGAAYNNLGVLCCNQGELDKGLDAFQQALAIPSENKPAKYNLGLAYAKLHKRDEAIVAFKGYVQIEPSPNGWVARAKRAIKILEGGEEF
jgi:tetratricopeptide (TPR) repeat protein